MNPDEAEAEAETERPSADRIALRKELEKTAAALSPRHAAATPLLCEGDPAVEIPRLVASMSGVLLVLGTHGGSTVIRHLIGSVAEKVPMSAARKPSLETWRRRRSKDNE